MDTSPLLEKLINATSELSTAELLQLRMAVFEILRERTRQPASRMNYIEPGIRGSSHTRLDKSLQPNNFDINPEYFNPYECGPKQSLLPVQNIRPYVGPYNKDPELLRRMGVQNDSNIPSHIRNINVESSLLQKEATRFPGQRDLTSQEINRFQYLPFNPQDPEHIVWKDDMPRGGYSTRNDRLYYD